MYMLTNAGQVSVNVDGKRYTAVFQVVAGSLTVTSGAVSRTIDVSYTDDVKSAARTLLRAIVSERTVVGGTGLSRPRDQRNRASGDISPASFRSRTRH